MKQITSILFLAVLSLQATAMVKYVKMGATGANNGTSWQNAYTDLQSALTTAITGDEVWVAAGVYKPTTTTTRTISFALPNGVAVYGGFAGTELTLSSRNIASNVTVLSGDIGTPGTATDNSVHVVSCTNVNNLTKLDGFKIIAGYANGAASYTDHGAGLFTLSSSPTIKNCTFTTNFASYGGAIACRIAGSVSIESCTITGNNSDNLGGGIYCASGVICNIYDCSVNDNVATATGGGAYLTGATVTIDRCIFSGNTCNFSTGYGGALHAQNGTPVTMLNTLIVGNASFYDGAGSLAGSSTMINCTIAGNKTISMGTNDGSFNPGLNSKLRNCIFWGNIGTVEVLGVTTDIAYTLVEGGYIANGNPLAGILTFNPGFVSPGNAAAAPFNLGSFDYSLQAWSPAIDIGDNSSILSPVLYDILQANRIFGGTVDLGAYENQYCALPITITASGPTSFCYLDSVILSVTGGTNYLWSTGAQTASVTALNSGVYQAIAGNGNCRGMDTITVNAWPLPIPTISQTVNTLTTQVYNSYQWYLGSNPISGATSQTYSPTIAGNYFVKVSDVNGCFGASVPFSFTVVGIEESNINGVGYLIYPNPAHDELQLNLSTMPKEEFVFSISDLSGKTIYSRKCSPGAGQAELKIDLRLFARGMYLVTLQGEGVLMKQKLLID